VNSLEELEPAHVTQLTRLGRIDPLAAQAVDSLPGRF
jgi:L-lactate dehydrogenase (cytochrome)